MTGHGTVALGGVVAGGIKADFKFNDGSTWHFDGVLVGLELGIQWNMIDIEGDFPGYSHIEGRCLVGVLGAGTSTSGTLTVSWRDTQGEIGTVKGRAWGEAISVSGGTGSWSKTG